MPSAQEAYERLSLAIADGEAIDWARVEAEGILTREAIGALRTLEDLRIRVPEPPVVGLVPGRVIGDFRLVARIGEGGMGQVWSAEQLSIGRLIAVKFVRPEWVTERRLEFFAREARAGGRLSHPGLVTIYGHGRTEGFSWIAMELVSGGRTLRTLLEEAGGLEAVPDGHDRTVARLVSEVAEALQAVHAAGVVHRDLKPQNVLLTAEGNVKVTDFGLARIQDESSLSASGEIAGTYLYMSPEQASGLRNALDHRSDVFSLGVMLYELLTLRRPFEGDTGLQVLQNILSRDPPDPRTIRSRLPLDLAVITGKAMEKERGRRYQSMAELAADLRSFLADRPIRARPPSPLDQARKWMRRNPTKGAALAVGAAALAVISGLLVENVRAKRSLESERLQLANANLALELKTSESERNAAEARGQSEVAEARFDEVLQLSALQKLDDLMLEIEGLWPAIPQNIHGYRDWLFRAEDLLSELPGHERKLAELREKSLPWTEEERAARRAAHRLFPYLERARARLRFIQRQTAAIDDESFWQDPSPAEAGVDYASLPKDAQELYQLAWPMIDPARRDWGQEEKGLLLARHALELAVDLPSGERAKIREALAWALFAAGRFDEAVVEQEQAVEEAGSSHGDAHGSLLRLKREIEEIASEKAEERHWRTRSAELEIDFLEPQVDAAVPEWTFNDARDQWWHDQLTKLVERLKSFGSEEGPVKGVNSKDHGWGIRRRLEFALTIEERSITGPEARGRWAEAQASIRDQAECPMYGGLVLTPQVGLLPIGRDPESGLWEFAHLPSGEPAARAPNGRLVLVEEETGLVLVLLPGGTFWMGAQRTRPLDTNFDPNASNHEGPVHDVTLSPFFLSKYEMTQGQWWRVAGLNPSRASVVTYSSSWNAANEPGTALHPVENVTWSASTQMMGRLGLTLPTEAQWEYGARGGTTTRWWTGNEKESLQGAANLADRFAKQGSPAWTWSEEWLDDGNACHAQVGSYRPNPFGLHDVCGNVWEWCRDVYVGYEVETAQGDGERQEPVYDGRPVVTWFDELLRPRMYQPRAIRGGAFNGVADYARSSSRDDAPPDRVAETFGLRPARTVQLANLPPLRTR